MYHLSINLKTLIFISPLMSLISLSLEMNIFHFVAISLSLKKSGFQATNLQSSSPWSVDGTLACPEFKTRSKNVQF
jgi:hypothetical protein